MTKTKYNEELLDSICERDECTVDKTNIKKYNANIKIKFTCHCDTIYEKTLQCMYEKGGAFCSKCTAKKTLEKKKQTYIEKYGVEHPLQSTEIKEKIKQTCIEKYGVENPLQSTEIKEKKKQTYIEKYGVEHPLQSTEIKEKIKQTCIEKYGVENPSQSTEIKEKKIQTSIEKYGVEYSLQSIEIKEKVRQTFLERYGVENPLQNAEVAEKASKNAYKLKSFTFPCGNVIVVQGYEPFLLQILVNKGHTYNDIITNRTDVPEIWYKTDDNKKHRYYCDIYIPSINTIYEVKSTWTYQKDIQDILLKQEACVNKGYCFELFVFNSKGEQVHVNDE